MQNDYEKDFIIMKDTTSFSIYNLSFQESGGFNVRQMSSEFAVADKSILFRSSFINSDSSILNIPLVGLKPDSTGSFENFIENVRLDISLDRSLVSTSDLKHFLAPLDGIHESVNISGRVFGTVAELRGRDILINFRNNTRLDFDFEL